MLFVTPVLFISVLELCCFALCASTHLSQCVTVSRYDLVLLPRTNSKESTSGYFALPSEKKK